MLQQENQMRQETALLLGLQAVQLGAHLHRPDEGDRPQTKPMLEARLAQLEARNDHGQPSPQTARDLVTMSTELGSQPQTSDEGKLWSLHASSSFDDASPTFSTGHIASVPREADTRTLPPLRHVLPTTIEDYRLVSCGYLTSIMFITVNNLVCPDDPCRPTDQSNVDSALLLLERLIKATDDGRLKRINGACTELNKKGRHAVSSRLQDDFLDPPGLEFGDEDPLDAGLWGLMDDSIWATVYRGVLDIYISFFYSRCWPTGALCIILLLASLDFFTLYLPISLSYSPSSCISLFDPVLNPKDVHQVDKRPCSFVP
ncbi:hypothetical protein LZ30DRAFT_426951 [Colletotrichum cereale]|nr:hypothetical protein LZ30DRAFT_426951 [Colletotrichum cereale]